MRACCAVCVHVVVRVCGRELQDTFGIPIETTVVFDQGVFPRFFNLCLMLLPSPRVAGNMKAISQHIASLLQQQQQAAATNASSALAAGVGAVGGGNINYSNQAVAVIGMQCRFPGK